MEREDEEGEDLFTDLVLIGGEESPQWKAPFGRAEVIEKTIAGRNEEENQEREEEEEEEVGRSVLVQLSEMLEELRGWSPESLVAEPATSRSVRKASSGRHWPEEDDGESDTDWEGAREAAEELTLRERRERRERYQVEQGSDIVDTSDYQPAFRSERKVVCPASSRQGLTRGRRAYKEALQSTQQDQDWFQWYQRHARSSKRQTRSKKNIGIN